MKKIKTEDAVGQVICHDITQIIPDVKKDSVFRKGHIVQPQDIPVLLSVGKDHLYVWEENEEMLHENESAEILCNICKNKNISATNVKEGKIEFIADTDGLYRIDVERLDRLNSLGDMIIASRHTDFPVKKGDKLAGTRIIPLMIEKIKMEQAIKTAGDEPLMQLLPYKHMNAGIITTGNEVFYKRIKDAFTPVVISKLSQYGINATEHIIVNDEPDNIVNAINQMREKNVDLILCTGGMSVDPDDMTPFAIKSSGAKLVTYGSPVLPGAMFLLAYFDDGTPVLGLPGGVMYCRTTVFDLALPRIAAGVEISKNDIIKWGHGGYCLNCEHCYYPNCCFGK